MASLQTPEYCVASKMRREPIAVLVDSVVDRDLTNAQVVNAREIMARLDPERFHVTVFHINEPDPRIAERPNTTLIRLPGRLKTAKIFKEFVLGRHDILFYLKAAPASKWYLQVRRAWKDSRAVIGSVESQSDYYNEPTVEAKYVRLWEQTILRCDYLFSNSNSVKKSLQLEYGRTSEVVPTGVDTDFFTPAWERPANPRLRVLFVGSLYEFKGPQVLLQAAPLFPDADFIIAGAGYMAQELKERAGRAWLANVHLTGSLDRDRLLQELQRADVFFFPSRSEGSPKVILEAAACGLPVVARKDYEPETVIDGETGYLSASDEEGIVRLGELLRRPDLRRSFGRASRKLAERFDWDTIVPRWEEIFLRVTWQKSSGPVP
jgi:glycosyltransferase involved in cell wall biosynthesis